MKTTDNTKKLYQRIASALEARENCARTNNQEWFDNHSETIDKLTSQFMPSGSGIDCGTKFDFDRSTSEKLVFTFEYHHMNENGMYDGWTDHSAIVTPSLSSGINIKITGRNRNEVKDYLHECYDNALRDLIAWEKNEQGEIVYFSPDMREAAAQFQARVAAGEIQ